MRLSLTTQAIITKLTVEADKNGGKKASVTLVVSVDRDESAQWGEDFEDLAFGTMREMGATTVDDDEDALCIGFLVDKLKPGKRWVPEMHEITIAGHTLHEQPVIHEIQTIDGESRVLVEMRLKVPADNNCALDALLRAVNEAVELSLKPSIPEQIGLGLRTATRQAVADNEDGVHEAIGAVGIEVPY